MEQAEDAQPNARNVTPTPAPSAPGQPRGSSRPEGRSGAKRRSRPGFIWGGHLCWGSGHVRTPQRTRVSHSQELSEPKAAPLGAASPSPAPPGPSHVGPRAPDSRAKGGRSALHMRRGTSRTRESRTGAAGREAGPSALRESRRPSGCPADRGGGRAAGLPAGARLAGGDRARAAGRAGEPHLGTCGESRSRRRCRSRRRWGTSRSRAGREATRSAAAAPPSRRPPSGRPCPPLSPVRAGRPSRRGSRSAAPSESRRPRRSSPLRSASCGGCGSLGAATDSEQRRPQPRPSAP